MGGQKWPLSPVEWTALQREAEWKEECEPEPPEGCLEANALTSPEEVKYRGD